jgi:hypothetical protein
MNTVEVTLWQGPNVDQNRPVRAQRPCPCGCDLRDGPMVGYVSGSVNGKGITLVAQDESTYQRFVEVFGGQS